MRMNRNITLLALTAGLIALSAANAQSHPPGGGGGGAAAPSSAGAQQSVEDAAENQANRDREFIKKTMSEDSAHLAFGALVEKNSQNEDLKQLAKKMDGDRSQFASLLQPLAQQLGVGSGNDMSRKDKKLLAKLQGLSGPQFDDEFISSTIKELQQELKDFNEAGDKTQNTTLKDVAKDGVTMDSQHLQLLQAMTKSPNTQGAKP